MDQFLQRDVAYVTRVDEILWGGLLLALTIAIHGVGMFVTLRASNAIKNRTRQARSQFPLVGLGILILAAWMIVLSNLIEVMLWARFFVWQGAQPNIFSAFYHAILNFTTLAAGYLPMRWRLLEGMLGMAGLLTLAWSTSILYALASEFMQNALLVRQPQPKPAPAAGGTAPQDKLS